MPDAESQAALAAAAAQIASLSQQLTASNAKIADLERALQTVQAQIPPLKQQVTAANQEFEAAKAIYHAHMEDMINQFNSANAATKAAQDSRDALAAKFDAFYGPIEEGITSGPTPYVVTADKSHHATLDAARNRKVALQFHTSDTVAAELRRQGVITP